MDRIRRDIAADPLLVKAGVLTADGPAVGTVRAARGLAAPEPRSRRSELMGASAVVRPALTASPRTVVPDPPRWRSSA